eukprot:CAMPEP_0179968786 /NCGR_PEP_ID=MMETSP0983-20121128/34121_1 /TAXON_ID=483367 /ORGANISM="non described non described, Strain CCMP 2436" /LENGTH=58 /DNA_ID=CAMNT_0021882749 /DNA_START=18 /DNA_END=191 /DNA_ORIENTATION=+
MSEAAPHHGENAPLWTPDSAPMACNTQAHGSGPSQRTGGSLPDARLGTRSQKSCVPST